MGFPPVIVEVAFATNEDETLYATGGWSDITSWVRSISGFLRGRNYETNRTEAGTLSVELDNLEGRFTPNRLSPYWPYIEPEKRLRVRGKNMVAPNIARGGGAGHSNDLIRYPGLEDGVFTGSIGTVKWNTHVTNTAPVDDHIEITVLAGANSYNRLISWVAPIETATRLTHSAYVWKVSGTEPGAGGITRIEIFYFDKDGNQLLADQRPYEEAASSSTPIRLAFSHAPYGEVKYALISFTVWYPSASTSDVTYAITGVQTELPNNLAPNISAKWDVVHWQASNPNNIVLDTTVIETDSFTRSVSNGWGSNEQGLSYTIVGTAANASVNGTKGLHSITAAGTNLTSEQLSTHVSEFDVTVTVGNNVAPAGSGSFIHDMYARYIDSNNYLSIRLFRNVAGGTVTLLLRQVVGGVETNAGAASVIAGVTTTSDITIRFQGLGTVLKGKAWLAGSAEPASWTQTFTTTWLKAGVIRFRSQSDATLSNAFPMTISYDNLTVSTNAYINRDESTGSAELVWVSSFVDMFQRIPHLIPGETYSAVIEVFKLGGGPNILFSADDGLTGSTLSTENTWTTLNIVFEASSVTQELRLIPQGTVVTGDILRVRGLRIEKVDNPSMTLASAGDTGVTAWERPLDIFEGWVESWPWKVRASFPTITVVDRLSRVGEIELANTLPDSLDEDDPDIVIPFNDEPNSGAVAWSGNWAESADVPEIPFVTTKGDLMGANYVLGTIGPTEEPAIDFNPHSGLLAGYFLEVPYSTVTVAPAPPPVSPPPAPPPPPKATYMKAWPAIWSRTYNGDDLLTRFDDSPYMYQGTYDGANGNYRSLAGFYWQDIVATLSGAEILNVWITLKNVHWRWNAGESVHVGLHTYASKPGSWSAANVAVNRWDIWYGEGQWKDFQVHVSVGYEFASGFWKGIAIGPGSGGSVPNADYGYFMGATHTNKPTLTVQYRK